MLYSFKICYITLCNDIISFDLLCYILLHYIARIAMLYHITAYSTTLCEILLYGIAVLLQHMFPFICDILLRYTICPYTALQHTTVCLVKLSYTTFYLIAGENCNMLYSSMARHITLPFIILSYTVLYYITLYYTMLYDNTITYYAILSITYCILKTILYTTYCIPYTIYYIRKNTI